MTGFLKKLFWVAAVAGIGYVGYEKAPHWNVGQMVGVPSSSASEAAARTLSTRCVDMNTASYQELQGIKYVNPIRAKTILEVRMERPFQRLDDLTRIKGINSYRVEEIRSQGLACVP